MTNKTPGQTAYEADLAADPFYDDGSPRKAWDELIGLAKESWERNPTPRGATEVDREWCICADPENCVERITGKRCKRDVAAG